MPLDQAQVTALPPEPSPAPTPMAGASPAPSSAPTATEAAPNPFDLPPEVAQAPIVQMVSVGAPPAVRVGAGEYFPELDPILEQLPTILQQGLDLFKAQDESFVFFNPLFITEQELAYLDQNGQLASAVPDYASVTGSQPQEIPDEEIGAYVDRGDALKEKLMALGTPQGPAPGAGQATGAPTPVPAADPGAQQAAAQAAARAIAAMAGEPTTGPRPGGGRLLNALLAPTA